MDDIENDTLPDLGKDLDYYHRREKEKAAQKYERSLATTSPGIDLASADFKLIRAFQLELQLLLSFIPTPDSQPSPSAQLACTLPQPVVYPIYVGNYGIGALTAAFCDRLTHLGFSVGIDPMLLQYILVLAYTYRIASINDSYLRIDNLQDLKLAVEDILLPKLLVNYIRTIGVVTTPCGVKVMPYGRGLEQLYPPTHQHQISPSSILVKAGRLVPNNTWCIDRSWIQQWNQFAQRISTFVPMSKVDYSAKEGGVGMLCSYRNTGPSGKCILGFAPAKLVIKNNKLRLYSSFRYRDYKRPDLWLDACNQYITGVQKGYPFEPDSLLLDHLKSSM